MQKVSQFVVGFIALGLLLASCGDAEADHRAAVEAAIPNDLAFAEPDDAACLGAAIEQQHSLVGLESKGLGTEALTVGSGDLSSLFEELDAETIATAYQCIDADERVVSQFSGQFSLDLTPGCVAATDLADPMVAATVLGGADIDVSRDLRAVVRGCLSDEDFSTLFGLDSPAALAAALEISPGGLTIQDPGQATCVGDYVVAQIGAERLNDADVSIAQPDPYSNQSKLSEEEQSSVLDGLIECEALEPMLLDKAISTEPTVGACAIERLSVEARRELFETIRTVQRRWERGDYSNALNTCIDERLDEIYGAPPVLSGDSAAVIEGFKIGFESDPFIAEFNRYEDKCMTRYFSLNYSDEANQMLIDFYESGGDAAQMPDGLLILVTGAGECLDPMRTIRHQLDVFEFGDETQSCIMDDLPLEIAEDSMDSVSLFLDEPQRQADYIAASEEIERRIDECATSREFQRLDDILFGSLEPESA